MRENKGQKHNIDKGYAWVILFGCSMMYLLLGGATKSYGILYVEFLTHFKSGSASTAWMPSIFYMIAFGFGPFSNYFGQKVSFRVACFVGALILGAGYICSAFVTRMEHMYFTYGIICGIGYGISYSPFTTIINYYFDKQRSLANGIMAASSGAGAFIFPLLYRYLIDYYGLHGALWIIGAILLNACPAACLLRQPEIFNMQRLVKRVRDRTDSVAGDDCDDCDDRQNKSSCMLHTGNTSIQNNHLKETEGASYITAKELEAMDCQLETETQELLVDVPEVNINLKLNDNEKVNDGGNGVTMINDPIVSNHTLNIEACVATSESATEQLTSSELSMTHGSEMNESLLSVTENSTKIETELVVLDWQPKTIDLETNSTPSHNSLHRQRGLCSRGPNLKFSLFTNPKFAIMALSLWLFMLGFVTNLVVFPAHIVQVGLSEKDASICVSILGVSDVIARIGLGWFSDRKVMNLKWMFILNMVIGGVFGIILPYFKSFTFMAIYASIIGVFIGSFWSLFQAMVIPTIGLKDFASGFGLLMMGFGCLTALFLPFIGWLEDVTGSWDTSFRVTGAVLLLAALTQVFENSLLRLVSACMRKPRVI